jgi:hypothetical protein
VRLGAWWNLAAFLVCTASVATFYGRSQGALGRSLRQRVLDVPAAMTLGIGMSLAQTRAVLGGLFHKTGEFVRTPKRGDAPTRARYRSTLRGWPWLELAFAAWFTWSFAGAVRAHHWGSLPFLALFLAGFSWVAALSLRERLLQRTDATPEGAADDLPVLAGEGSPG